MLFSMTKPVIDPSNLGILQFTPLYQERVWGGRHLESLYGRTLPKADVPYGESWEICDRPEAQTVVTGGQLKGWSMHDLWTKARSEVFGSALIKHPAERFPLLIKILDAQEDLSIQVHPNDATAASVNGEAKSEAWYVASAKPGARLYAGLKAGTTPEAFQRSMEEGTVAEYSDVLDVDQGACLAIPGGTLHAIGAGLVIYEVQQNSDTTYRVFDWNRTGLDGVPRELHKEQAMKVLDFNAPPQTLQPSINGALLDWEYFKLLRWDLSLFEGRQPAAEGRFAIGAVVHGKVQCSGVELNAGDFFLVPACLTNEQRLVKTLSPSASLLWTTM